MSQKFCSTLRNYVNSHSRINCSTLGSLLIIALASAIPMTSVVAQNNIPALSSKQSREVETQRIEDFWKRLSSQQNHVTSISANYDVTTTTPANTTIKVEENVTRLTQEARSTAGFAPELEKEQQKAWREAFRKAREGNRQKGKLKLVRHKDRARASYSIDFGKGLTRISDSLLTSQGVAILMGNVSVGSAYSPGDSPVAPIGLDDPMPIFLAKADIQEAFPPQRTQVTFIADEIHLRRLQDDSVAKVDSLPVLKLSAQTMLPLSYETHNKDGNVTSLIEARDYVERIKSVWVPTKVTVYDAAHKARAEYILGEATFNASVDPIVLRLPAQTQINDYRAGESPVTYDAKDGDLLPIDEVRARAEKQQEKQQALAQMKAEKSQSSSSRFYLIGAFLVVSGLVLVGSRRLRSH